ncbi:MAG TPA: FkbM family methyltransferase [Bryobacteraceae bacterium]|nr:FkbM family methyltransferase [Bryobacteraceae bacterium]
MTQRPSKSLSTPVKTLLKGFIVVCILFTSGLAALNVTPGLAILPFAWRIEKSPYCTVWQAVTDGKVKIAQADIEKNLLAKSHPLRTDGAYKLWTTPKGDFWVPDTRDEILAILLAQQDRKIYGTADTGGVRKGDIVLDGGAHIGLYVKTALEAGAEKVIAIEPSPEALECLRRNFEKEIAAGKVLVYPKGIWDEEKRLLFYANGNGAAGDSFLTKGAGARVVADIPVTTIDKLVKELNLPRVDLIKADIKGAGTRMIHGAAETIRAYHPRMVISVEEAPEDPAEIYNAVMKLAPQYRFRAGPCMFTGDELRNDTIFFQ